MSGDSTSIMDLPTDPIGGGSVGGNVGISMQISDNSSLQQSNQPQQHQGMSLDQQTISQIVNGLQQASVTGATQLPSRDIPQSTENIIHDPKIQANYIPQEQQKDYISDYEDNQDIINNYNRNIKNGDSLDEIYDEIQIPLLISVLYFLFQLPIFKKYLYKFFPALFANDGNINIYGLLFMSILFGLLYYILSKIMNTYSKF
jgi:hypothetical protein